MAEESNSRWEGKTSAELASITSERAWFAVKDFCNLHKWLPPVETCYIIEGVDGQPGAVRYCASTTPTTTMWVKEKLLVMDPVERCISYEVVESNMGFKSYVATVKVFPISGDEGCRVEWSFVCDPLEGWTYESFYSFIHSSLQSIANKIELTLSDTHQV